ncbi:MAG: DsbE family thiol:disulfide interchange protein [Neomegalonema sp.]|nr:DsbE family thiol:disulfide interchange protein [Neomegalonema sp.]
MSDTPETPSGPQPKPLWKLALYAAPFALFAALGAVLAQQVLTEGAKSPRRGVLVNAPAPALELPLLGGGGQLKRAALTGTGGVVIVNFWASWCAPCRIEHPALMELAKRKGVTMFGVAYNDDPRKSQAFLSALGDPFKQVGVDRRGFAAVEWGVRGVPETFILSADGTIIHKHSGPIEAEDLEKTILPAIAKAQAR